MRGAWLLVPVPLVAAACGGTSTTSKSTSAPAAATSAQTVKVTEKEFSLTPATFTGKPGAYTFRISNQGKIRHALAIDGPGVESKTGTIAPGGSTTLAVTLSKPGKYELYCPIDDHKNKGMKASLTIEGAGSSAGMQGTSPAPTATTQQTTTQKGGYGY